MDPDSVAIAYDASVRALDSQEEQLSGLHTRASFLLGAAGIATGTVLGGRGGTLGAAGVIAVVAFGATAILATSILVPRRNGWRFTSSATVILDTLAAHPGMSKAEVLDWLARTNQNNYAWNKDRLDGLYNL